MAAPTKKPAGDDTASDGARRILIIDDDRELCQLIRDYLEPMGYQVETVHHGTAGLERALEGKFDALILDVMLPGLDGFEILKRVRHQTDLPVLMLTARGEEADRIVGLECGADDYLPKTFSARELLARLRAVLRRTRGTAARPEEPDPEIVVGPLRMNPAARTAVLGDQPMVLTALEYNLLLCLAQGRGRVKSREQLLEAISERNYDVFDRSIDVHISSLRKKLGDDPKKPRFIRTIHGVGYVLINPDYGME